MEIVESFWVKKRSRISPWAKFHTQNFPWRSVYKRLSSFLFFMENYKHVNIACENIQYTLRDMSEIRHYQLLIRV